MSLKTVTKNFPQLLVLSDVIQKGTKMLDPTTLAELDDRSPIEFDFVADMLAGQNSKTFAPTQIYQSKYDKNKYVIYGECFDNSGIIGMQTNSMNKQPSYYIIFLDNGKIVYKNFSNQTVWATCLNRILIYEDNSFYYFLENMQNDSANNLHINKYNKFDYSKTSISANISSGSVESIRYLGIENGLLKLLVPNGNSALYSISTVNMNSGKVIDNNSINIQDSSYGLCSCVIPSKIYNNCIYTMLTTKTAQQTSAQGYVQKTDLDSKSYKKVNLYTHYVSSFNGQYIGSESGKSQYSTKNGTIFEKEDKEGNKYMIVLSRCSDGITFGYLIVVDGNFALDNETISLNDMEIKQEFKNVFHFISCDENDDTLLIGDGFSIKKIKWNTTSGMYDVLSDFNLGSYQNFQLDNTGKIWVRGDEDITRILPSQGVVLNTSFDRETYQYEGEPINTFVNVSLKNQNGEYAKVEQYLYLSGPAIFTETGTNYKKVSFDGSDQITIPVTITEGGSVDCFIQF